MGQTNSSVAEPSTDSSKSSKSSKSSLGTVWSLKESPKEEDSPKPASYIQNGLNVVDKPNGTDFGDSFNNVVDIHQQQSNETVPRESSEVINPNNQRELVLDKTSDDHRYNITGGVSYFPHFHLMYCAICKRLEYFYI